MPRILHGLNRPTDAAPLSAQAITILRHLRANPWLQRGPRNAKRDGHLRSADFFDVDTHPIVTFELTSATPAADDTIAIAGVLRIRDNALAVQAPAHVSAADPNRVTLSTQLSVDRAAAGVGWSKMGMIQGTAHLHASITLTREH
jgi:polyisoprenoid-binding protein YceI